MAERRRELDVLIRRVSADMQPITLDEVMGRVERQDFEFEPVIVELAATEEEKPLDAGEVIELARHRIRSGDHGVRRSSWVAWAAAAVALVAGFLAVLGFVRDLGDADRIDSSGPGFVGVEGEPAGTSTSAGPIGSTTVLTPAEQAPSVVTLDADFGVLALLALDDGTLAVAGEGNTIQFWDPDAPDDGPSEVRLQESFDVGGQPWSVTSLGRLPSGGLVVASSFVDSMVIEEIDPGSGVGLRGSHLTRDVAPMSKVTMLPGGDLAVGGTNGLVTIEPVGDDGIRIKTAHTGTVLTVAGLPDGRFVSGGSDGTIRIWDPTTGVEDEQSPISVGHAGAITVLAVLADGRVASADSNGGIRIWDPVQPVSSPELIDAHAGAVHTLVELPDRRLASGGADGIVRIWDLGGPTRDPVMLDQHTAAVNAVAVLPDGRLASGSSDTTVRIWNVGGSGSVPSGTVADPGSAAESADTVDGSGTDGESSGAVDIPVLTADRAPIVVDCETGPPDYPPNDGESDLEPTAFPTPDAALDHVLASIPDNGMGWKELLVRIDTPDGSINYAAPLDPVLPVGSQPVEEALFLVVVRPSSSGQGFVAISWEMVGC
ncbi:MAG: hypothetical protein OEW83_02655 [Acidimicrobiia bacterium]|nr:hypothetical protein [Acidimicrobiia bacterium]